MIFSHQQTCVFDFVKLTVLCIIQFEFWRIEKLNLFCFVLFEFHFVAFCVSGDDALKFAFHSWFGLNKCAFEFFFPTPVPLQLAHAPTGCGNSAA